MTLEADPYRTLGLARGASIDEVKRAYRRLAKANHPDAAGASALPRFLAIQAAYEQLVEGKVAGNGRRPGAAPHRPWDPDPTRADATRRAYGSRPRPSTPGAGDPSASRASGTGTAGAAGTAGSSAQNGARPDGGKASWSTRTRTSRGSNPSGASSGGAGSGNASAGASGTGRAGATGGRPGTEGGTTGGSRRRSDRPPKKATLGSTSYDGVDGPFEPDWRGASWYGTTSGTYWTLNPKEYADPRKHGPEYQARARRAARPWPPGSSPKPDTTGGQETVAEPDGPPEAAASGPIGAAARPTHTTSSWWDSTAGRGADPEPDPDIAGATESRPRSTDRRDPNPADAAPPPDLGRAMADIGRALTDTHYGGWRGRVARAVIGWLPIALGLGWLIGEISGCGRFAATCDGSAGPIGLALQLGVLAVLLAIPVLASLTTMASLTVLGASFLAALILSATGSAADGDSRRAALGFVLVVAWLVGLAIAIWKRWGTVPAPTRPVS
jgi:Meckel syndrome type 1 protein